MTHWKRSVPYLLILFYSSHANQPILLAKPYPFNRSESSRIECFTNDQSLILSLTILVTLLDNTFKSSSSFQSTANNITKNGSIVLNIPSPFNYSQLDSPIQCRSKYYHGEQKVRQLDVLSVVEIPEKELLTINTNIKQLIIIHCPIYGTNVCKFKIPNRLKRSFSNSCSMEFRSWSYESPDRSSTHWYSSRSEIHQKRYINHRSCFLHWSSWILSMFCIE